MLEVVYIRLSVFVGFKVEEEDTADAVAKNEFGWLQNESFAAVIETDDARYFLFFF